MNTNQKIIIFEGHDMTGKTEIAKALSDELEIPYFKNNQEYERNYDSSAALKYQATFTQNLLEATGQSIIFDRFWPSEAVYSKVLGRPTYQDILGRLDCQLSRMNSIILILEKNEEDYIEDTHNMIEIEKYNALKREYYDFHQISHTRSQIINVSKFRDRKGNYSLSRELNAIQDALVQHQLFGSY